MTIERIKQFISSEKGVRVGFAVLLVLTLSFMWVTVGAIRTWYTDSKLVQEASLNKKQALTGAPMPELNLELPKLHLFGQAGMSDQSFLPITSLQLHLTGIVKSSTDYTSKVIISEAGQPGKVYAVGDVVTSGIRISAVNAQGVVLEHGGRLEKLPLSRPPLIFHDAPTALTTG